MEKGEGLPVDFYVRPEVLFCFHSPESAFLSIWTFYAADERRIATLVHQKLISRSVRKVEETKKSRTFLEFDLKVEMLDGGRGLRVFEI